MKKVLGVFDLEVRRRTTRRTTMGDVLDHIKTIGFKPASVIDVGVAYGTPDLYQCFPDARFLLVEPMAEWEPTLKKILNRIHGDYVLAAAGPLAGTATLNVHEDLSGTTALPERGGTALTGTVREVRMVRLDTLCREMNLEGPLLIKVDVQGAELSVMDGATGVLDETEVVILETNLMEFFENGPQFYDVVHYMKQRGFVVYDVIGGHYRPLDNALAGMDLVFVKDAGLFRKSPAYVDPAQRGKLTRSIARRRS